MLVRLPRRLRRGNAHTDTHPHTGGHAQRHRYADSERYDDASTDSQRYHHTCADTERYSDTRADTERHCNAYSRSRCYRIGGTYTHANTAARPTAPRGPG